MVKNVFLVLMDHFKKYCVIISDYITLLIRTGPVIALKTHRILIVFLNQGNQKLNFATVLCDL